MVDMTPLFLIGAMVVIGVALLIIVLLSWAERRIRARDEQTSDQDQN